MAISYTAGTNLITLTGSGASPVGGTSWANAYDMEDVLASCAAVVTKQGANAYDISARIHVQTGCYFVSKSEFVELKPNPINPTYVFLIDAGGHVQFGDYNSTDKYSYNGAFWRVYVNSTTNQQNLVWGEWLIYGSNVWTDAGNYQKGIHAKAGATLRIYNSIIKDKRYFWAANTNMQDVKWIGGTGTYDMLFATAYDYAFSGVSSIDCNYGLFFSSTTNAPVDVYNQKFQNCTYDVGLISCSHLIRVINSPFTTYYPLGSGRSFKECYEFNVKVTNDQGFPIVGAMVSLKDIDGTNAFTPIQTVSGGILPADEVVVAKWFRNAAQGGNKDYNDHILKVVFGSDETEYKIKIDHKISEDVVLLPQSVASYDNIMAGINAIQGSGFTENVHSLTNIEGYTDKIDDPTNGLSAIKAEVEGLGGEVMRGSNGVPTNPLLTNDARLDNLDATVSSRSSHSTPDLSNLDVAVSTRSSHVDPGTPPTVGEIRTELEDTGTKITLIKTATDQLNFTGEDVKATLDNEEVTTDTASRNASKADVSNLDVTVSSRSNHVDPTSSIKGADNKDLTQVYDNEKGTDGANTVTPPTVTEIKTELEGVGTKITGIKDKTDNLKDTWNDPTAEECKATGFATENPPSQNLDDYKANVSGVTVGIADIKGTGFEKNIDSLVDIRPETDKIQSEIIAKKDEYKADVSNLDVAVSTRSSHSDPTSNIKGTPGKTIQETFDNEKGTDGANTTTPPTAGEIRTELEGTGTKLTDIKTETDKISAIQVDLTVVKRIEKGRWKIINNQMIFYNEDGVTPLYTFNLLDKNGNPAEENIVERVEV